MFNKAIESVVDVWHQQPHQQSSKSYPQVSSFDFWYNIIILNKRSNLKA
ncbi:hypothetical protein KAT95_00645 [Candidatus Parcubacteria bacterium]|nr:hypothetical protein [Candidatus Parcubacteria bacterium]